MIESPLTFTNFGFNFNFDVQILHKFIKIKLYVDLL